MNITTRTDLVIDLKCERGEHLLRKPYPYVGALCLASLRVTVYSIYQPGPVAPTWWTHLEPKTGFLVFKENATGGFGPRTHPTRPGFMLRVEMLPDAVIVALAQEFRARDVPPMGLPGFDVINGEDVTR